MEGLNRTALRNILLTALLVAALPFLRAQERWTEARANAWYAAQPWPVGSDFLPSTAINELEMWQADTFDPVTMDRELGWAQAIGMNTMRVFLHNLLWEQDPDGFKKRINTFLTIAARHHIRPIFVLFDSCWDPFPKLGPQHPPIPGVHNSGWVQAPGAAVLADPAQYPKLQEYVVGVVRAFANDPRILAWDVWNEPHDEKPDVYGKDQPVNTNGVVLKLVSETFAWARSAHPTQPLTSGVVFDVAWTSLDLMPPMARMQIEQSDIITFHNYSWPENFEQTVLELQQYHRPLICTEYMLAVSEAPLIPFSPSRTSTTLAPSIGALFRVRARRFTPGIRGNGPTFPISRPSGSTTCFIQTESRIANARWKLFAI